MALQKRRLGPARIHHRRSSWMRRASRKPLVEECPECQSPRIRHRVCMKCGYYRGEQVMDVPKPDEAE